MENRKGSGEIRGGEAFQDFAGELIAAQLEVGPADAVSDLIVGAGCRSLVGDALVGVEGALPVPQEAQNFRLPEAGLGDPDALGVLLHIGGKGLPGPAIIMAAVVALRLQVEVFTLVLCHGGPGRGVLGGPALTGGHQHQGQGDENEFKPHD